jgi:uncharacterized damage-inducible protein DinB
MAGVTTALVADLFDHMEWADAAVWRAVCQSGGGAASQRRAWSDDSLRGYLVHLHSVQQAFLAGWTAQPPLFRDGSSFATDDEALAWVTPYYGRARALLSTLDDAALDRAMVMPWHGYIEQQLGRPIAVTTLGETMIQVASHSTYHRGQVNARLRALAVAPPLVDYIAWLWDARPRAAWP